MLSHEFEDISLDRRMNLLIMTVSLIRVPDV